MLSTDRAVKTVDRVVNDLVHVIQLAEEPRLAGAAWLADVEVDIAVTEVTEGHGSGIRDFPANRFRCLLDEFRN